MTKIFRILETFFFIIFALINNTNKDGLISTHIIRRNKKKSSKAYQRMPIKR